MFLVSKKRPFPAEIVLENEDKSALLSKCVQQLTEYFEGMRYSFDLPLQQEGSPFRQKIWRALQDIPYGVLTATSNLQNERVM